MVRQRKKPLLKKSPEIAKRETFPKQGVGEVFFSMNDITSGVMVKNGGNNSWV